MTDADLDEARRLTAKLREQEPVLLAPVPQAAPANEPHPMTAEDVQREAQELVRQAHRRNPGRQRKTWREHQRVCETSRRLVSPLARRPTKFSSTKILGLGSRS